ncbi:MAG: response regulator [Acidobacteriia bacterium]|nr:response regulator [Terriglobia bacterium]
MAAYLTKPVARSELLHAVLQVLGERSAEVNPSALVTRHSLRAARRPVDILLAEDNQVNQALAVRLLEKHGYRVQVAGNGIDAVTKFEAGRFDAVLMDVQMPEMDGFEATAAIRKIEKARGGHIPVIAMTAHAMKGDRDRCLAAGMDGYVAKPIHAAELFQAIGALIRPSAPPGE